MKDFLGTIGFVVVGMGVFRLIYGAWPPKEGQLFQWFAADPKARWALAAGLIAGALGAIVGRKLSFFSETSNDEDSAADLMRRGLKYHEERKISEAIEMFQQAISLYGEGPDKSAVAPAHACLAKAYFDLGELENAEASLVIALELYRQRQDKGEASASAERLLTLISERRQKSDTPRLYEDAWYPFSFTIPAEWLPQKLHREFTQTGGRISISHISHAATFSVSVGPLDKPEWSLAEVRVVSAEEFWKKKEGRVGSIDVKTFVPIDGEENVVVAECFARKEIGGSLRQRRFGLVSILHDSLEYVIQWSAEAEYEEQTRKIISSFKFQSPYRRSASTRR